MAHVRRNDQVSRGTGNTSRAGRYGPKTRRPNVTTPISTRLTTLACRFSNGHRLCDSGRAQSRRDTQHHETDPECRYRRGEPPAALPRASRGSVTRCHHVRTVARGGPGLRPADRDRRGGKTGERFAFTLMQVRRLLPALTSGLRSRAEPGADGVPVGRRSSYRASGRCQRHGPPRGLGVGTSTVVGRTRFGPPPTRRARALPVAIPLSYPDCVFACPSLRDRAPATPRAPRSGSWIDDRQLGKRAAGCDGCAYADRQSTAEASPSSGHDRRHRRLRSGARAPMPRQSAQGGAAHRRGTRAFPGLDPRRRGARRRHTYPARTRPARLAALIGPFDGRLRHQPCISPMKQLRAADRIGPRS